MDPVSIIAAINAGVSIVKSVQTAVGIQVSAKEQAILDAGTAIVQEAGSLYVLVKADLSANDQASVDAALVTAMTTEHADMQRVLAEIAADVGK